MRAWLLIAGSVVLSGLLLAFALPPHGWSPLGWVVYVPLLMAVKKRGFAVGFTAALLSTLFAAWVDAQGFLLPRGTEDATSDWIYAGFLLFGLVAAFITGLFAGSERFQMHPYRCAAFAVFFEGMLLFYLPAHLALTQSRSTVLLYVASWVGIWGVSYLLWYVNFWIARDGWRRAWILIPAMLSSSSWLPAEKGTLPIAMIQSQSYELAALNKRATEMGAEVAVWPELAATSDVDKIAEAPNQCAFVTSREEPGELKPFNVAHVFSELGESIGYKKRKPFAGESQTHASGDRAIAVPYRGINYGLIICFDSCFPRVVRDTARLRDVQVILIPTLDPNTTSGVAQSIHAAYTPFRAAEFGVPMVRTDASGYSMAVDSRGRVIAELENDQDAIRIANVKPGKRWTLVTLWDDWFMFACMGIIVVTWMPLKRRKAQEVKE